VFSAQVRLSYLPSLYTRGTDAAYLQMAIVETGRVIQVWLPIRRPAQGSYGELRNLRYTVKGFDKKQENHWARGTSLDMGGNGNGHYEV
jgi:hypothetical protein